MSKITHVEALTPRLQSRYVLSDCYTIEKSFSFKGCNSNMKRKKYIIILLAQTFTNLFSQQLTGLIPHGGELGSGIIYEHNITTNSQKNISEFITNTSGYRPLGELYELETGMFFGFNHVGGTYGSGTLFCYNAKKNSLKDLIHFNGKQANGLIRGAAKSPKGILYFIGVGSENPNGTIYAFNPKTNMIVEIFQISSIEKLLPNARIKDFKNGKLYCDYTTNGGREEKIFVFNVATKKVVKTINLPENNRFYFWSSDHKLYSMAHSGTDWDIGMIYLINTTNSTKTKVASIDSSIDFHFLSSININEDEIILSSEYSKTYKKGFLLKFNTKTNQTSVVFDFSKVDFGKPSDQLFLNLDRKIHGYSSNYDGDGKGWIYSFDWKKHKMNILTYFDTDQGNLPSGNMIQLNQNKFIGLSASISTKIDKGAIVVYDKKNRTIKRECPFNSSLKGSSPSPFLSKKEGNNWIGVAQGGKYNQGVIYTVNENKQEVLYNFTTDSTDGSFPYGELVKHMKGKFYGITRSGGKNKAGTLYSFDSKTMHTIHHFKYRDGQYPNSICIAKNGRVYGTTQYGGTDNSGTIFSFDPSTKEFNSFDLNYSYDIKDLLIQDEKLYLFAGYGASGGALLEFDLNTGRIKLIRSFSGKSNGIAKVGRLTFHEGIIYGTVSNGGTDGKGLLFHYDTKTKIVDKLVQFKNTNYSMPTGRPIISNKLIYFGIKTAENKTGIISYNQNDTSLMILKNSELNSGEPGVVFINN